MPRDLNAIIKKTSNDIKRSYNQLIDEVAKLSVNEQLNNDGEFFFKDNPVLNRRMNHLLKLMYQNVYGTTVTGINSGWDEAVKQNNQTALDIFGKNINDLPENYKQNLLSNNGVAKDNFVTRKTDGLGLSDRVWRNAQQFKQELELSLEQSIEQGASAAKLAKDIKQYLNNPDKLFRRVRDSNGVLRLSKAALAYNPGRGVYRSSYKNAVRLARNEINFSYEGSNHLKRQQQDFVVGIEIRTSPQHEEADDKGGVNCTALQGKYPKNFDFTNKWHVSCICISLNILKTKEELFNDIDVLLAGGETDINSVNLITAVPQNYTNFINDNPKVIKYSRTLVKNTDIVPIVPKKQSQITEIIKEQTKETKPIEEDDWEVTPENIKLFEKELQSKGFITNINFDYTNLSTIDKQLIKEIKTTYTNIIDYCKTQPFLQMDKGTFFIKRHNDSIVVVLKNNDKKDNFNLVRTFYTKELEVIHDLFMIPKAAQGKGSSKQIFKELYKGYLKMGLKKINVHANIDIGGYTWGRYGFCMQKNDLMNFNKQGAASLFAQITDEYFKDNPKATYFPMNVLAETQNGKQILLGSDWEGFLDLTDNKQKQVFEDYLNDK